MSKMQMLFFAVGIGVVAFLFLNFVTSIGLQKNADALIVSNLKIISDQTNSDLLCSFKQTSIPDKLVHGVGSAPFFYDLEFVTQEVPTGDSFNPPVNTLILRLIEHKASKDSSKINVVSARSITSEAEFILIDPSFLADLTPLNESTYKVPTISLYPRAASTQGTAAAPNGFVVLKEVVNGRKFVYIIPCASEKEPNNCLMNVFRVGCYKLKQKPDKTSDTLIDSCFNIILPSTDSSLKTKNYTWKDCVTMFPAIASQS
jgi:hypothetical protein